MLPLSADGEEPHCPCPPMGRDHGASPCRLERLGPSHWQEEEPVVTPRRRKGSMGHLASDWEGLALRIGWNGPALPIGPSARLDGRKGMTLPAD